MRAELASACAFVVVVAVVRHRPVASLLGIDAGLGRRCRARHVPDEDGKGGCNEDTAEDDDRRDLRAHEGQSRGSAETSDAGRTPAESSDEWMMASKMAMRMMVRRFPTEAGKGPRYQILA